VCADPAVKGFGIRVETKMADVGARVLNPPLLAYQKPSALTPGTRVRGVLSVLRDDSSASQDSQGGVNDLSGTPNMQLHFSSCC
jgi:hypothetical protein